MRYSGETGGLEEIDEISGACHKRFKTNGQAEAFIEDWKESFAGVWGREMKKALDQGLRPWDMKLSMEGVLHAEGEDSCTKDITKQLDTKLRLG